MSAPAREVHPVADLFPMLAEDELRALADDIKLRGLRDPVLLDGEGRVLDGRNRLAACKMAGVKPTFVTYDGDDPEGEAWSRNVRHRHLSKAQLALAAADRFADKDLSTRTQAEAASVSQPMIVWAQTVRRYPDLRDAVRAGQPLYPAYEMAQRRDQRAAEDEKAKERLRFEAADLLSLVDEDRMSLDDAVAALDAREDKARQEERALEAQHESERRAAATNLRSVLTYLTSTSVAPSVLATQYVEVLKDFDPEDIDYAADTMSIIAKIRRGHDG